MIVFNQENRLNDLGKESLTPEAEAIRLSNELRAKPAHSFINPQGIRVNVTVKRGFDIETADFMTIVNWLADTRIKKSESLIAFVHRVLSVKFPNEYANHKDKIDSRYKLEYEMIQANSKNDIAWLGEVGFSTMVRLDGTLNNDRTKVIRKRNKEIEIRFK